MQFYTFESIKNVADYQKGPFITKKRQSASLQAWISGRSTTALGRNIDRIERNIESIESKFAKMFKRPKNERMARILTIFGRNPSSRRNLSFQKVSNKRKIIESIESIDWIGRSIDRIDRWPPWLRFALWLAFFSPENCVRQRCIGRIQLEKNNFPETLILPKFHT